MNDQFGRLPARPLGAAVVALVAGAFWYRRYTTPFPYSLRWMLDKEFPGLSRADLLEVLGPEAGEELLEVGPGTGLFTVPVAALVAPHGSLTIVDIQQQMLDHTVGVLREQGLANVRAVCCDACSLPFPDSSFDAAFSVTALGEVGDTPAALSELARVLRPGGRLVIGEFLIDWHAIKFSTLERRARQAGLLLDRHITRNRLSYLARFTNDRGNDGQICQHRETYGQQQKDSTNDSTNAPSKGAG